MEKIEGYKYTAEQKKRFAQIIKENGLKDEDPDNFVFHVKTGESEKIIRLSKKEMIDLKDSHGNIFGVKIEDAVKATKEYPDLPFSEALEKIR